MRAQVSIAALLGFALMASAALGAHALFADGAEAALASWQRAITLGLMHVLASLACALLSPRTAWSAAAGWAFIVGVLLFAGVQMLRLALAETGGPSLDVIALLVPLGGLSLMAGWLLLAVAAWRTSRA